MQILFGTAPSNNHPCAIPLFCHMMQIEIQILAHIHVTYTNTTTNIVMDTNDLLRTIGTASSINHPCCTPLFGQVIKIQIPKIQITNTQIHKYKYIYKN